MASKINTPVIALLVFYKRAVSPWLPTACRFQPSCSVYARECFERFGLWKALRLTLKRLLRCHPFGPYGFDPVPAKGRKAERHL